MLDTDVSRLVGEASDAYAPSQADLAAEIGVRPLALTTWRNGRSRPTAQHLRGMARALERKSERLRDLAARLDARAAVQGKLTRRPRRTSMSTARLLASRMVAAGEGRVLRVVFYGSRTRGTPRSPSSDWDFIVVLKDSAVDADLEAVWLKQSAAGTDDRYRLDIWPMDPESWETARHLHGHPVRSADQEGIVLYDAG